MIKVKITKQELVDFECDGKCCALDKIFPNTDTSLACDSECYFCKFGDGRDYLIGYVKKNFKIFRECIDFKNRQKEYKTIEKVKEDAKNDKESFNKLTKL